MLNVAVAGLGWWGRLIVDQIAQSTKLRVVHAVDPADAQRAFAQQKGIRVSERLEDALADENVQGVVLCTPHTQHADQIVAAANAGKHVFCEKPLSMTRADVLRAVDAVEKADVALAVGHEKRFDASTRKLMNLLRSGELGTPMHFEGTFAQDKFLALPAENWRLSNTEAPAGPMTAVGIHLLDLAIGVLGEAETAHVHVRQLGSRLTNGDTLAALVTFKSGASALIGSLLATAFTARFAVYGSNGWVEARELSHPESPEGCVLTTSIRGQKPSAVELPPSPSVLLNLEAFADAASGQAPYPVPRSQMIANVSALEAIFRSAKSGLIEKIDNQLPG